MVILHNAGSTAFINKWSRAKSALECGIDLVIELPVLYAISSAENFADGAIKILNSMKVVDYVSFGAETADINALSIVADTLLQEPKEYKLYLNQELKKGLSFPSARQNALALYLNNNYYSDLLALPNNILGIEYLKALKKYNSNIQAIAMPRFEVGHNDLNYYSNIASSTSIRNILKNNGLDIAKKLMPDPSFRCLLENLQNRTCCT